MPLHVIPVPDGYTPEQAWQEIQVFGHLYQRTVTEDGQGGRWAAVYVDDE